MEKNKSYLCVNDFAPKNDKLSLYFKKVGEKKSDGFAVIVNGEVYVIDAGRGKDEEMLNFLLSLREKWLAGQTDPAFSESSPAKLEIHIIVSHPHPDHVAALPLIFSDPRFCILSVHAPERAYRSKNVDGALAPLVNFENRMDTLLEYLHAYSHTAREIHSLPYGIALTIPLKNSDTVLDLYPSPFDWSEDRPSDSEGFRFLLKYSSPTYQDNPELGYANGILNGNSLWVKITKGNQSALITGDQRASEEMLDSMIRYYGEENFRCDILKLPHHGEKNYPPYLLEVSSPKIMIFTASEGYQTPETVALCKEYGDAYHLCDGNLVLTLDGKNISAEGISPRK